VIAVANDANRCPAVDGNATHFGAWQAQRCEATFLRDELNTGTGATGELAAATRSKLHVVDDGTDRDVADWQCAARADLGGRTIADLVASGQTLGGEDVALLAIMEVQECDTARAVRVVFDRGNGGGNAILVALESGNDDPGWSAYGDELP